jgi:hypothetical protein
VAILAKKGYQQVKYLTESPTFHIQVVPLGGPVSSTFDIDSEQIKKVSRALVAFSIQIFQIESRQGDLLLSYC